MQSELSKEVGWIAVDQKELIFKETPATYMKIAKLVSEKIFFGNKFHNQISADMLIFRALVLICCMR